MTFFRVLAYGIASLFSNAHADRRLYEELQSHLDLLIEQNLARGLSPDEAHRAARLSLGGADQIKESVHDHRGFPFLDSLAQDIRFAARTLRKSPGFATVAILTLALGIGANTAMFSIVDAVLLRPLPFADPSRIVEIGGVNLPAEGTKTLTDTTVYETGELNFAGAGAPERIAAVQVSQNFFELLRVHPIAGRTFLPAEEAEIHPTAAILSYDLWRSVCNSDPGEVGKQIHLNGSAFTVVGIMPPGFDFPSHSRLWITHPLVPISIFGGNAIVNTVLARLRFGVTLGQAVAEVRTIQRKGTRKDAGLANPASVTRLRDNMVSEIQPALLLLLGAVGLVLLIACANVANLILARSSGRSREFAVRAAIGASRARLVRQLLTESILLSLIGGALGILLGVWSVIFAKATLAIFVPFARDITLDLRVLIFALAAAVVSGVVTGLVPALQFSRPDLSDALKENARNSSLTLGWNSRHRLGSLLCVAEISAALVLLVGAGLLIRSFANLLDVNPGYRTDHLVAARLSTLSPAYAAPEARLAFFDNVLARTRALPGVQSAALINTLPLAPGIAVGVQIKPAPASPSSQRTAFAMYLTVSPGYFQTMGIPLLAGRDFNFADRLGSDTAMRPMHAVTPGLLPPGTNTSATSMTMKAAAQPKTMIAIVSKSLADQVWPGQQPVGEHFDYYGDSVQVVGLVADVRALDLTVSPDTAVYFPISEQTLDAGYLVVHTSQKPSAMAPALRSVVSSVDKAEPISEITTMRDVVSHSVADARFRTSLLGLFAAIALLLAVIGIYGVISYSVGQRTREIGIRIALGAERRDILRLVLRGGALLVAAGIAIGLVASLALAHLLTHYLFGVRSSDPITFIGVALVLLFTALAACYIPARRAMQVDPVTALRYE